MTTDEGLQISQRMQTLEARTGALETAMAENTALTKTIERNTSELVDAFASLKGALKTLSTIGRVARPVWYILAAVGAAVGLVSAVLALINTAKTGGITPSPVAAAGAAWAATMAEYRSMQ